MKDITSKYNIGKLTESALPGENTVNEVKETSCNSKKSLKKSLIQSLIKLIAISIVLTIIIIFSSFGWFTYNKETETDNMMMVSDTPKYELSVLTGGSNGIYYDNYHQSVQDSSAIVWQMTEENNMDNYGTSSKGIHPGSCGVISFYITPKVESVDLKFTFEVVGYVSEEKSSETEKTITQLEKDSVSAEYLNGHILLFEERSGNSDSYTYSKPILSNEDMKRVISSNTYTGKGNRQQVNIYWVWPNTLSTLVDARSCTTITVQETPFTTGEDYNKIVENIITYPDYYLKNVDSTSQSAQEGESTTPRQAEEEKLTEEIIARDYDKYGDLYDQADNDIGMGVDFIMLKLSVSEADSNGE
ncbi:MAG: hypothetical protein PUG48_07350 [Clostridia bacterium]|nr:hypothetical protein [Clostridia bacterium]